jgi:hypothetical protein
LPVAVVVADGPQAPYKAALVAVEVLMAAVDHQEAVVVHKQEQVEAVKVLTDSRPRLNGAPAAVAVMEEQATQEVAVPVLLVDLVVAAQADMMVAQQVVVAVVVATLEVVGEVNPTLVVEVADTTTQITATALLEHQVQVELQEILVMQIEEQRVKEHTESFLQGQVIQDQDFMLIPAILEKLR